MQRLYNRKSPPRTTNNRNETVLSEGLSSSAPTTGNNNSSKMGSTTDQQLLVEQVWKEICQANSIGGEKTSKLVEEGGGSQDLKSHLQTGWTTDQASQQRELIMEHAFNVVKPPIDCPNWLCIILPCINHIPSMKMFAAIKPDDAELLRNGRWIRYDATSLVPGDIIKLEEGDIIPADCMVVIMNDIEEEDDDDDDLLVDSKAVTGQDRLHTISLRNQQQSSSCGRQQYQLYMGSKVVQGHATAIVTQTGPRTLLGKLIQEGRFPPREPILEVSLSESRCGSTGGTNIQLSSMT